MAPLESLALLVADLNAQVRAQQDENLRLRNLMDVNEIDPDGDPR